MDEAGRPQWLFGNTVHDGCDRAGYYEQSDFADEYGSPKCIVKLGGVHMYLGNGKVIETRHSPMFGAMHE